MRLAALVPAVLISPGADAVRTLHNPYGNGFSAVLIGGSDTAGVVAGTAEFAAHLDTVSAGRGRLTVGWTMLTKIGEGLKVPKDLRDFETSEDSKGYGSRMEGTGSTISETASRRERRFCPARRLQSLLAQPLPHV